MCKDVNHHHTNVSIVTPLVLPLSIGGHEYHCHVHTTTNVFIPVWLMTDKLYLLIGIQLLCCKLKLVLQ